MESTKNSSQAGRIRDLDVPGSYIDFYYIPDSIPDTVSPDWSELGPIIGRSAPIQSYGHTGARTLQIDLHFVAESDAYEEVFKKITWIQSLKYPEYRGQFMKPPHRISLVIGRFIAIDGILKDAPVTWKAPYDSDTMYPMLAETSLTIEEVVDTPYGYERVRDAIQIGFSGAKQVENQAGELGHEAGGEILAKSRRG